MHLCSFGVLRWLLYNITHTQETRQHSNRRNAAMMKHVHAKPTQHTKRAQMHASIASHPLNPPLERADRSEQRAHTKEIWTTTHPTKRSRNFGFVYVSSSSHDASSSSHPTKQGEEMRSLVYWYL